MGQVKIWLNALPDISEFSKYLLLIMINYYYRFLCDPLWLFRLLRIHIFCWSVGSLFAYRRALLTHCGTQRRVMYSVGQNKGRSLS